MNPFHAKNLKTNYNVTPYGDHGTERVKTAPKCAPKKRGSFVTGQWCLSLAIHTSNVPTVGTVCTVLKRYTVIKLITQHFHFGAHHNYMYTLHVYMYAFMTMYTCL
jgi:hypothetical protein